MILVLLIAAGAAPDTAAVAPSDLGRALHEETRASSADACKADSPGEIVVCKRRDGSRYRIDPVVLEAAREHDAVPGKAPLATAPGPDSGCVGPQTCTGGVIPLVGVALAAVDAAVLAAKGDDWRDAFRTHPDEYRLYQEDKARRANQHHVTIGFGASAGH